jgi:thiamine biosynthesis protein ThiS
MKVHVAFLGEKRAIMLKKGSPVRELLEKMRINPETVLVGRNGEIVPETESLREGDRIEIIRTISGG